MRGPIADSVACTVIDLGGSKAMPEVSILGPTAVRVVPAVMVFGGMSAEGTDPLVAVDGCVLTWGWGIVCNGFVLMMVPDGRRSTLWAFPGYRKTATRSIIKTGKQYFTLFFVIMIKKNPLIEFRV